MKKEWWEDWHYYYSPGNKLTLNLPNSKTFKQVTVYVKEVGEKKLQKLFDLFNSAFDRIQTDHGGYKK